VSNLLELTLLTLQNGIMDLALKTPDWLIMSATTKLLAWNMVVKINVSCHICKK